MRGQPEHQDQLMETGAGVRRKQEEFPLWELVPVGGLKQRPPWAPIVQRAVPRPKGQRCAASVFPREKSAAGPRIENCDGWMAEWDKHI